MVRKRDKTLPMAAVKDPRFMSALSRGLAVLQAFPSGNRPIGNFELAEAVGLPKATVSRITFTLTELGFLTKLPDSGKYQLTSQVLSLGYSVMAQMEIRDIARPFMQELADYANASIYLGIRDGCEMLYVEACRAPASMAIRLGVGSRIPLATTGMGRAFLAALPPDERRSVVQDLKRNETASAWKKIESNMTKAIAFANKNGFAMTIGEWISEANSAGCAIRRPDGYPVYGINLGGLRSIITKERLSKDLGPRLVGLARQIEQAGRGLL